ncbi:MAG: hypothetical protein ACI93N_001905 [Flavobacteriaceae bacterium]|jgi:hypothetical protein
MGRKLILFFILACIPLHSLLSANEERVLKSDYAFFSLAYYHLYEKNIPNNLLNNYLKAVKNIGDKELMKNLILQSLINIKPINNLAAREIDHINLAALSLPNISDFKENNLINLIEFYLYNELCNVENINKNIYESGKEILYNAKIKAPNITSLLNNKAEGDIDCAELNKKLMAITKEHQSEFDFFVNYFESELNNTDTIESEKTVFNRAKNSALKNNPGLLYIFSCGDQEHLTPDNNKLAIFETNKTEDIFKKLLNRTPTIEEKKFFDKILLENTDEKLKIVYYIIMTLDEYNYY